jgi:hypothetical protein
VLKYISATFDSKRCLKISFIIESLELAAIELLCTNNTVCWGLNEIRQSLQINYIEFFSGYPN